MRSIAILTLSTIIHKSNAYLFGSPNNRLIHIIMNSQTAKSAAVEKTPPKWASAGILSDFVNLLISTKPLYKIMKCGARKTIIDTAETKGVPWGAISRKLESIQPKLNEIMQSVTNPIITYPEYYTQEFHAYDSGNLEWPAAYEVESATMGMALRIWPKEILTPLEAQERLRQSFLGAIINYKNTHNANLSFNNIIDIGCSAGVSTYYLAKQFTNARKIFGLDLSPYFLSIAKHRQDSGVDNMFIGQFKNYTYNTDSMNNNIFQRIHWAHQNAEKTSFESNYFDLVSVSFVLHEIPREPTNNIINELYRITNKGGIIAITDNDPQSPVIRNLPPVLFTLMKSTEPWSDDYYAYDLEGSLAQAGFANVTTLSTDPRHRTVLAVKV